MNSYNYNPMVTNPKDNPWIKLILKNNKLFSNNMFPMGRQVKPDTLRAMLLFHQTFPKLYAWELAITRAYSLKRVVRVQPRLGTTHTKLPWPKHYLGIVRA